MGRSPCCTEEGIKKGAWTADEDQKLIAYIEEHGEGGWRTLPQKAGLQRCGKSCRLRWANYLRPGIKRGKFSTEEEQKIIQLHAKLGNRWSAIARHLPKRTDNEIKNYWNTYLKKRNLSSHETNSSESDPVDSSLQFISADTNNQDCPSSTVVPIPKAPAVSASARLLNKMATSLSSPSICLETFKSIISRSRVTLTDEYYNCLHPSASSAHSISNAGLVNDGNRMVGFDDDNFDSFIMPFDLDIFGNWHGTTECNSGGFSDAYDYTVESPASLNVAESNLPTTDHEL